MRNFHCVAKCGDRAKRLGYQPVTTTTAQQPPFISSLLLPDLKSLFVLSLSARPHVELRADLPQSGGIQTPPLRSPSVRPSVSPYGQ